MKYIYLMLVSLKRCNMIDLKQDFILLFSSLKLKNILVNLLLLFIGILAPSFSPSASYNFYARLTDILMNNINMIFLLIVIVINIINITKKLKTANVIIRFNSYSKYINSILKINIINSLLIIISSIIIAIISSFVIVFYMKGDFSFINHEVYKFNQIFYLLFFEFRAIIFIIMLATIVYYVYQSTNEKITLGVVILILLTFFIDIENINYVNNLKDIPFFVTRYFTSVYYSNIYFELSGSIIQFILLNLIIYFLTYHFNKRKELI